MASVLIDTNTYKITLEIVEDFINLDFVNFLKKGYDPKSEKIITWEMLIYCKMLDNKSKGYVNYYLLQLKKLIKEKLNKNLYLVVDTEQKEDFYIKTYTNNNKDGFYFITPEVQICKFPALIKISFYCEESKFYEIPKRFIESEFIKYFQDLRKITYISQLQNLISLVLFTVEKSEYFINFVEGETSTICEIIKSSIYHNIGDYKQSIFGLLFLIVVEHYTEMEKILIDIATKEMTKETVKQVTNCQMDAEKISRMYNVVKDFHEIHLYKFYKFEVIRQIKQAYNNN